MNNNSLLTIEQLAKELQISKSLAYRLAKSQEIPSYRFGGTYRFNLQEVLDATRQTPTDDFAASFVGNRRRWKK